MTVGDWISLLVKKFCYAVLWEAIGQSLETSMHNRTISNMVGDFESNIYTSILLEGTLNFAVFSITFSLLTRNDIGVFQLDGSKNAGESTLQLGDMHYHKACVEGITSVNKAKIFLCPHSAINRTHELIVFGITKEDTVVSVLNCVSDLVRCKIITNFVGIFINLRCKSCYNLSALFVSWPSQQA